MKKITIAFIFCLLGSLPLVAQNTFQHSYSTNLSESPTTIIQTTDKGYALLSGLGSNSGYLVKVDSLGNKKWSKEYNINSFIGSYYNPHSNLIQATDKGYLFCGGNILVKTDSTGNVKWARKFNANLGKVIQTLNGYVISEVSSASIIKTDFLGNLLWTSSYKDSTDNVFDMVQASDSCFYILYSTGQIGKLNKNGKGIWCKNLYLNGYQDDYFFQAQLETNPDGKTIELLANHYGSFGVIWFAFDTSGIIHSTLSHTNIENNNVSFTNYKRGKENDLVFSIVIDTSSVGEYVVLLCSDSIGNIKWSKRVGGPKTFSAANIIQTKDEGIAALCITENYTTTGGLSTDYLIKIDSTGGGACNTNNIPISKFISPANISLVSCCTFLNGINPSDSIITLAANAINDTDFNACNCVAPHAGFSDENDFFIDTSRWASKWYWSFGDSTYDSIDISPLHLYKDTGMYTVCLTVKNACGTDSVCHIIDYQHSPVSLYSITSIVKTNIFPNPFTTSSTVQFGKTGKHYLELDDITGRQLRTMECNNTNYILQRNGLAQGIYILNVFDSQMKYETSLKLIVE